MNINYGSPIEPNGKPHRYVDGVCLDCGDKHRSVWTKTEDGLVYGYNTALTSCTGVGTDHLASVVESGVGT